MGYGNSHNTILLPDEEEQLVREELGRIANNANVRRDVHGTTSPLGDGYVVKLLDRNCMKKTICYIYQNNITFSHFFLGEVLEVTQEARPVIV